MTIRKTHPHAGGLVIAADQAHAAEVARLMHRRLRVRPVIATSEDPDASAKIARFAASSDPWIVAVKMISEGVDIPRLRVGVFATTTTTELFFRQAVGRLVRWIRGDGPQKAYMFIPDDARLRMWASQIAEQRRHSLRKPEPQEDDDSAVAEVEVDAAESEPEEQLSLFSVISAVATSSEELSASVFGDDPDELGVQMEEPEDLQPDPALAFALAVPPAGGRSGEIDVTDDPQLTRRQQKTKLRKQNSELVRELVHCSGRDFREVNAELNRLSGVKAVGDATVKQLQVRLDRGEQWLKKI